MKNVNLLPDLSGKSAIIFERTWLAEELPYLDGSDKYYVLSIDRNIYLKNDWIFTSMQGASMVASLSERLYRSGVKKIIRIGTTGSLHDNHKLFDIVIPTAVYKDEGTSEHYVYKEFPCICDTSLCATIKSILKDSDSICHEGVSWTTDGRWTESLEKMTELKKWGVLSVDMETSAFYTVCFKNKIPCVSLNFITDFPIKSEENGLRGIPESYDNYKKELLINVNVVIDLITKNLT